MQKFLRRRDVTERYGVSRAALYNWIQKGRFPAPVRLGRRAVAWPIAELEAWDAQRIASRNEGSN